MSKPEWLTRFCDRYNVRILGESKRVTLAKPVFSRFIDPADKDVVVSAVNYETEPLITLELPKSRFEMLATVESKFYGNVTGDRRRTMFEQWVKQQEEEARIRTTYPAVEQAYQQYSSLLALCSNHTEEK